jgi:hypothetical protein
MIAADRPWIILEVILNQLTALLEMKNSKYDPLTINLTSDATFYLNLPVRLLIPFIAVTHRYSTAAIT